MGEVAGAVGPALLHPLPSGIELARATRQAIAKSGGALWLLALCGNMVLLLDPLGLRDTAFSLLAAGPGHGLRVALVVVAGVALQTGAWVWAAAGTQVLFRALLDARGLLYESAETAGGAT